MTQILDLAARRRRAHGPQWRRGSRRPPLWQRFTFWMMAAPLGLFSAIVLWPAGWPAGAGAEVPGMNLTDGERVQFSLCGSGPRPDCVVDGDTFWYGGEKIRIADVNTPETSEPACAREAELGARATERLHALLNAGAFSLESADRDRDRYGRLLRTVTREGESLGAVLVEEGLAERWQGSRSSWC